MTLLVFDIYVETAGPLPVMTPVTMRRTEESDQLCFPANQRASD